MISLQRKKYLISQFRIVYEGSYKAISGSIFDPPLTAKYDILLLQRTAKQIAEFIGLKGITPIINLSDLQQGTGGKIDLSDSNSKDIYIEIDRELINSPDSIHCILSHELAHKWLQLLSLEASDTYKNEIRTEIATVIVGLGKLMLNGCRSTIRQRFITPDGTQTQSNTHLLGYLSLEEFAYIYSIVCRLQSIRKDQMLTGLRPEAEIALSNWSAFSLNFSDESETETIKRYQEEDKSLQIELNELGKYLQFLQSIILGSASNLRDKAHLRAMEDLKLIQPFIDKYLSEPNIDPLEIAEKVAELQISYNRKLEFTKNIRDAKEEVILFSNLVATSLKIQDEKILNSAEKIACPYCEKNLRLPTSVKSANVTCPECNYKFYYNSKPIQFQETSVREFRKRAKKSKLLDRIRMKIANRSN